MRPHIASFQTFGNNISERSVSQRFETIKCKFDELLLGSVLFKALYQRYDWRIIGPEGVFTLKENLSNRLKCEFSVSCTYNRQPITCIAMINFNQT